ncbi:putative vegetative incompatibility protein [Podospora fimiseda]|uniref:Vegetative incompatibility protein n=1 Tax=Podospora fimiseda TaxID=252190 RepID=A0AAN6YTB2_9PEZI|nr:putative vegetative incompatibility protein [Podospora fimiseda]
MRLLKLSNTPGTTLRISSEELKVDKSEPYAILSHTWETDKTDELTLQELLNPSLNTSTKCGYRKTLKACEQALSRDNLKFTWVDTCCIDKESSAKLSEAIRSMYKWYKNAQVCYVYLSDLAPTNNNEKLTVATLYKCRWFSRGWTLQELIAPKNVVFFDQEWNERGTKNELSAVISEITKIPETLLNNTKPVSEYSVACRMSWASKRKTARPEDMAYCLLGIFGINMSERYGEGEEAFFRLQRKILKKPNAPDMSLFAWKDDADSWRRFAPVLATSPAQFRDSGNIVSKLEDSEYSRVNVGTRGIHLFVSLLHRPQEKEEEYKCILDLFSTQEEAEDAEESPSIGICLRKTSGGKYVRFNTGLIPDIGVVRRGQESVWSKDTRRMLVERIDLEMLFPSKFPFHDDPNDPVLGNRCSVLKINFCDPASPYRFSVAHAGAVPRSHWDIHHQVFFCSKSASRSWCGLFVHGRLYLDDSPSGNFIPVNFHVGSLWWNLGRPEAYIFSLHDMDSSLETRLEKNEFESCRIAESILWGVYHGWKGRKSAFVQTGWVDQASVESAMPKTAAKLWERGGYVIGTEETDMPTVDWYKKLPYTEEVVVKISVEINSEKDNTLCMANPVTRVDVRIKIMDQPPTCRKHGSKL